MAFIWLDSEGEGVTVQETASEARRKIEEDDEPGFAELLLDPGDGEPGFRTIFIDKASIIAIEQGAGVEEPADA